MLILIFVHYNNTGWKSWKLIAWTISPTPSLFVNRGPSTYSQGNMGKFVETRGGGNGVLEHKSGNISETRKDRGKVTMESYRKSTLFRKYHPDHLRPSVLQDWGSQPHPKIQTLLSQEQIKLQTSKLAGKFRGSIRTKDHCNFLRKGSVGVSRDCTFFYVPPISSGTGKDTNFKFCTHIRRIDQNKSPLKFSSKVAVGVLRESQNFFRAPIYRAHRAVIFAIALVSC